MRSCQPFIATCLLTGALACAAPVASVEPRRSIDAEDGPIEFVSFSPDGRNIGGCGNRFVQLFDAKSADRLRRFEGHGNKVRQFAFSPDGALLASCSNDKTIRLWRANSGMFLRALEGHTEAVACLAFFPDGKTLVSGSESPSHLNDIRLWDVAAARWDYRIREHHAKGSGCVVLSPDGTRCAVAGNAGLFTLYRVKLGLAVLFRLEHAENARVAGVCFSPDGRRLMSCGSDNTIRLWDVETGRQPLKLDGPPGGKGIQTALFLPDGGTVVDLARNGVLQVRDLEGHAPPATVASTDAEARGLALSPDGKSIATCGADGFIRLWDLTTGGK